jgi:hypothetical protein
MELVRMVLRCVATVDDFNSGKYMGILKSGKKYYNVDSVPKS